MPKAFIVLVVLAVGFGLMAVPGCNVVVSADIAPPAFTGIAGHPYKAALTLLVALGIMGPRVAAGRPPSGA